MESKEGNGGLVRFVHAERHGEDPEQKDRDRAQGHNNAHLSTDNV